jgi:membrane AbrB-like protein
MSQNYDVATVTIISVSRLVGTLIVIPALAKKWPGWHKPDRPKTPNDPPPRADSPVSSPRGGTMSGAGSLVLAALSIASGALFSRAGIPAGMLIGALAASGAFTLATGKNLDFPSIVLTAAQIGIGISIAEQIGPDQVLRLTQFRFLFALLASGAFTIAASLLLAFILQRITGWDPLTCILATSAGGLSQMTVVAEEMKADVLTVGILHLARYISIISCMPLLILLFLR